METKVETLSIMRDAILSVQICSDILFLKSYKFVTELGTLYMQLDAENKNNKKKKNRC